MDILSIVLLSITIAIGLSIAVIYRKQRIKRNITEASFASQIKVKTANYTAIDYGIYKMGPFEHAAALALSFSALFLVGYVFYQSAVLALLLTPFAFFYPKIRTKQIIAKRKRDLKLQFKDALQSLSSSLHAGSSFESAMRSAVADLMIQYEADSYIVVEFEIIIRKLESNETLEKAIADFAERSRLEEIQGFAEVLEICKRTGGNLITAIKSSTDIISDKIEVLNDIDSILAEKKLEQKILTVMPIALIFMLSASAKDFMQPVFTEAAGRVVMTISMILFVIAYFIAQKITDIEV